MKVANDVVFVTWDASQCKEPSLKVVYSLADKLQSPRIVLVPYGEACNSIDDLEVMGYDGEYHALPRYLTKWVRMAESNDDTFFRYVAMIDPTKVTSVDGLLVNLRDEEIIVRVNHEKSVFNRGRVVVDETLVICTSLTFKVGLNYCPKKTFKGVYQSCNFGQFTEDHSFHVHLVQRDIFIYDAKAKGVEFCKSA